MKKNVRAVMMVAAIAFITGNNVYYSQSTTVFSGIALANIEALAGCSESSSYTAEQSYGALNGCFCIHCPEPKAWECNCVQF